MPRWLGAVIFFSVVLVLWTGLHFWVYFRVAGALGLDSRARLVLKLSFAVLAVLYPAWRLADRWLGHTAGLVILWPANVWMGLMAIGMACLVAFDLWVSLPVWVLKHSGVLSAGTAASIGRWGLGLVVTAAVSLSALAMTRALAGPEVSDIEVRMPGLPRSMDGFRLVALSDIHAGELVQPERVQRIAAMAAALQPDLVVLVGDLSDQSPEAEPEAIGPLAAIPAKYGVVAVTGNHEFYRGGERAVRALEAMGVPVLRQGFRVVADGLVIAGVDDPSFLPDGRSDAPAAVEAALKGRPEGLPTILLSHQPLGVDEAARGGVGLMISGHTHGGQIPPFQILTGLAYGYLSGAYEVDKMTLYVNRGAGFWGPPMRLFADPEILRVTLRASAGA